jgi:hypothetical protein
MVRCALQARPVTKPRRADGRRSCRTCVCASRMSLFFSGPASCTRSGRREPAVVVKRIARAKRSHTFATIRMRPPGAADVIQPWGTIRSCVVNVITPGKPIALAGAIPVPRRARPALVNERPCIAQVAVSSANVRTAGPPRAGDVSPTWHASILVQQQTLGAAGVIPVPRRADARRSWKTCVCAPRMSLFFSGPASCTRSG